MPEYPTEDFLTEQELCAATGIDRYSLRRIRRWLSSALIGPFLVAARQLDPLPRSSAVPMILRFSEVLHEDAEERRKRLDNVAGQASPWKLRNGRMRDCRDSRRNCPQSTSARLFESC